MATLSDFSENISNKCWVAVRTPRNWTVVSDEESSTWTVESDQDTSNWAVT